MHSEQYTLLYSYIWQYSKTRRSGRYAPILLAAAEGWGPFMPLGALRALLGQVELRPSANLGQVRMLYCMKAK